MSKSDFNITRLAGHEALVSDSSGKKSVLLNTYQWDALTQRNTYNDAVAEFDAAVREFYAPLVEASEKAEKAKTPVEDEAFIYRTGTKVEAVEGQEEQVHELSTDSVIMRMIESGDVSRLKWAKTNGTWKILVTQA